MESIARSQVRSRVVPLLAATVVAMTMSFAATVAHPAVGASVTHVADSEWGD
jgi:hypothetical protein